MGDGSVFRRCSCVDGSGKLLGLSCPKRHRTGHGQWCYRIEFPADAAGKRRPRRRGGFESATKAQVELDRLRELLAVPDDNDVEALRKVGDLVADAISAKKPMPEVEAVRRLLHANVAGLTHPTLAQWLTGWLPTKKNLSRNTYRSYESHIRLYLIPYLGTVRIDKLRVAHMFDQIVEHNDEITAARRDPRGVDHLQRGEMGGHAARDTPEAGDLDPRTRGALATHRPGPVQGHAVDTGADRAVPRPHGARPALPVVPPRRACRAAAR
jgi:Phage integrase, N-terminal SAM-like domain